eukprot:TRINITY_DN6943_c0_g1_i4.p1 TRINITY_DN6943_c0_g1~~TRINITY_DN6943_c0_g1_i4.p1  ORF type:complete len:145 (+),score=16.45 TRINITY_DN6943_c0_g1_i4:143-577(+)
MGGAKPFFLKTKPTFNLGQIARSEKNSRVALQVPVKFSVHRKHHSFHTSSKSTKASEHSGCKDILTELKKSVFSMQFTKPLHYERELTVYDYLCSNLDRPLNKQRFFTKKAPTKTAIKVGDKTGIAKALTICSFACKCTLLRLL